MRIIFILCALVSVSQGALRGEWQVQQNYRQRQGMFLEDIQARAFKTELAKISAKAPRSREAIMKGELDPFIKPRPQASQGVRAPLVLKFRSRRAQMLGTLFIASLLTATTAEAIEGEDVRGLNLCGTSYAGNYEQYDKKFQLLALDALQHKVDNVGPMERLLHGPLRIVEDDPDRIQIFLHIREDRFTLPVKDSRIFTYRVTEELSCEPKWEEAGWIHDDVAHASYPIKKLFAVFDFIDPETKKKEVIRRETSRKKVLRDEAVMHEHIGDEFIEKGGMQFYNHIPEKVKGLFVSIYNRRADSTTYRVRGEVSSFPLTRFHVRLNHFKGYSTQIVRLEMERPGTTYLFKELYEIKGRRFKQVDVDIDYKDNLVDHFSNKTWTVKVGDLTGAQDTGNIDIDQTVIGQYSERIDHEVIHPGWLSWSWALVSNDYFYRIQHSNVRY